MSNAAAAPPLGRRERKKQQTREQIAEVARLLFVEHGFDGVTVAAIARVADVSEQTVFNHFRTKEELVYWRMGAFEEELFATLRARAAGETVLVAFGRFVRRPRGLFDPRLDAEACERLAGLARMITQSPALLAREQSIFAAYTASLAEFLAEESGASSDDTRPWIAANAMIGVHRALLDYARRRIGEGARPPRLTRDLLAQADAALTLLETGLGGSSPTRSTTRCESLQSGDQSRTPSPGDPAKMLTGSG